VALEAFLIIFPARLFGTRPPLLTHGCGFPSDKNKGADKASDFGLSVIWIGLVDSGNVPARVGDGSRLLAGEIPNWANVRAVPVIVDFRRFTSKSYFRYFSHFFSRNFDFLFFSYQQVKNLKIFD